MWQVLLAAAVAGSGYFAKHLLHKNDNQPTNVSSQKLDLHLSTTPPPSTVGNAEPDPSILDEEKSSIFRFSSASHELKNSRKKLRRNGGNKGNRNVALEKEIGDGLVDDHKKNGKKFVVCLKKRRIGRNASAKCDSGDIKASSSKTLVLDQDHTMWQVFLALAIPGSVYFAKQLLHKNDKEPTNQSPKNSDLPTESSKLDEKTSLTYRFFSSPHGSKNSPKKLGFSGGIKSNKGNNERNFGSGKIIWDGLVDDQRKSGKKFYVCLKKIRIARIVSAKCNSVNVEDKSSFGYGVGVGMMYMLSAGKAEIERLNTSVDETAKVVQELKAEIYKRKSLCELKVEKIENIKLCPSVYEKSGAENDDSEVHGFPMADEGEYASSILTEEPHGDVLEMGRLEAELESELLKLQASTTENSSSFQHKTLTEALSKPQDLDLKFNQCDGVMPSELDQKLCHLLIEQQESQIVDLESELQRTNSKLAEKESELQALKDCVKRLTDLSLTYPSDEETEGQVDEARKKTINDNGRSMVGIKRAIDFD